MSFLSFLLDDWKKLLAEGNCELLKARDCLLTLERPMFPSYRNQSFDLLSKSTDWFLYDGNIIRSRVKSSRNVHPEILHIFKRKGNEKVQKAWATYLMGDFRNTCSEFYMEGTKFSYFGWIFKYLWFWLYDSDDYVGLLNYRFAKLLWLLKKMY